MLYEKIVETNEDHYPTSDEKAIQNTTHHQETSNPHDREAQKAGQGNEPEQEQEEEEQKQEEKEEELQRQRSTVIGIEANPEQERTQEEDFFYESETPIAFLNMHIFEQIDAKGRFKTKEISKIDNRLDPKKLKDLFVTMTITDILNVNPMDETFTFKYRYFALWEEEDLANISGLEEYVVKAKECGHYYPLTRLEVEHFIHLIHLPKILLFNQTSQAETDVLDIRIYGGEKGKTAVMINQSFVSTCRERFVLNHFPFDLQTLHLEFRLNDARSWNTYNLTIAVVQFHKDCLHQLEWTLLVPLVKRGFPKTANSTIILPVQRKSEYYIQNLLSIIFILTALGLSTFAFESNDLVGRTFCVLTMILTSVAFKFTCSENLPKVPYSTLLDHYLAAGIWILAIMTIFTIIPNFYIDNNHTDSKINLALAMVSIGLIVIGFGILGFISMMTLRHHLKDHHMIPLEKERPWYSFRFSNPKFLIDLNPTIPFHESLKANPPSNTTATTANGPNGAASKTTTLDKK